MKNGIRMLLAVALLDACKHECPLPDSEAAVLLGSKLFFDENLSAPPGQACAVCHGAEVGWSGPDEESNAEHGGIYEGAVPGRFGNRRAPTAAYATLSPIFHCDEEAGEIVCRGGNFWDGRATGEYLGNPAADQAQGPFLNPLEQNNPTPRAVCEKVRDSNFAPYEVLFDAAFGPGSLDCEGDPDGTYDYIGLAIAAFEDSPQVNRYSSKFDAYLAGYDVFTDQEKLGLELFKTKGKCANCHTVEPGPNGEPPRLTDFTYDNLGVPRNEKNPFYQMPPEFNPLGADWIDPGLGGFLLTRPEYEGIAAQNMGKHKVPTLRNVDKRPRSDFPKAYTHNGYFETLLGVVHFYNTRDVLPACPGPYSEAEALAAGCWPPPEVDVNINTDELGDLGLTLEEELAIVAFMKTLSDP